MSIFVKTFGLLMALALGAGGAQAQTSKLRSLDTRNDALAWEAVGRLDMPKSYCTGTLIAPDLVLTAAHCVYDRSGNLYAPETMTFKAGLTKGKAAAVRGAAQIEAHAGYDPKRKLGMENVRHDVALVRLETPIPTHELNPFAVHAGKVPDGPVSVVSYGRGRSNQLARQNSCEVVGQRDRVVVMNCDVTYGSSGSPVFTHLNGRGRIASVISSIGTSRGKDAAFGMALPQLVSELKRQMRANAPQHRAKIRRITVGGQKKSSGAKFVTVGGS